MFALAGIVYAKLLPPQGGRLALALGLSVVSVAVELFLHANGTFHWSTGGGTRRSCCSAAWVFDAPSARQRWRRLGALAALDVLMGLVFGVGLGWL